MIGKALRFLASRWPWWVVPIVVLLLLTLGLALLGQGETYEPMRYPAPAASP